MRLTEIARTEPYREPGAGCAASGHRHVDGHPALAELHDFRRFQTPGLMAYVGSCRGAFHGRETSPRLITRRECAGPPAVGRDGVAVSSSPRHRHRARPTSHRQPRESSRSPTRRGGQVAASAAADQHKPAPKIVVAIARTGRLPVAALQPVVVQRRHRRADGRRRRDKAARR